MIVSSIQYSRKPGFEVSLIVYTVLVHCIYFIGLLQNWWTFSNVVEFIDLVPCAPDPVLRWDCICDSHAYMNWMLCHQIKSIMATVWIWEQKIVLKPHATAFCRTCWLGTYDTTVRLSYDILTWRYKNASQSRVLYIHVWSDKYNLGTVLWLNIVNYYPLCNQSVL